jgi:SAM-dependent methyltransferase
MVMAVTTAGYDFRDRLFEKQDPLVPKARLRLNVGRISRHHFIASGDAYLAEFQRQSLVNSDSRVLDDGCGCGRLARPLSSYLSPSGSYVGFDIDARAIDFCRHAYGSLPNFRFEAIDVRSRQYNPSGKLDPDTLRLPSEDGAFDFVLLISVLTHVVPSGLGNYLREIRRALRPGGRAWISYFLWTAASREAGRVSPRTFPFPYPYFQHRIKVQAEPEAGICYDEAYLLDEYKKAGLTAEKILYGSWWGGTPTVSTPYVSFQDVIVTGVSEGQATPG